ncbi:hypothetical protein [Serratia proteamaculans]|uniref:hypothetical protein n=1 Tax=Serratia proteamaculans TaxID=28151 RepID=UPI0021BAB955|nr:hypothetical protein [Serratia proteamaculans]
MMFSKEIKKYVMSACAMMLIANATFAASGDTAQYTEKRRLHCKLLERSIDFSDSKPIGSRNVGWLRKIDGMFASIEIDGWNVQRYGHEGFTDKGGNLFIHEDWGAEVIANRGNGIVSMQLPRQDKQTLFLKWHCDIGPNISK